MNPSLIVEFLDDDGSYIQALTLDELRCRVLCSNVARRGELLLKDPDLDWESATEDLGGLTRLGPWDLVPLGEPPWGGPNDPADLESTQDPGPPEDGESR